MSELSTEEAVGSLRNWLTREGSHVEAMCPPISLRKVLADLASRDAEIAEYRSALGMSPGDKMVKLEGTSNLIETASGRRLRLLREDGAEIERLKNSRESNLDTLAMKSDCNYGCGCGERHCSDDRPCQTHWIERLTKELADLKQAREFGIELIADLRKQRDKAVVELAEARELLTEVRDREVWLRLRERAAAFLAKHPEPKGVECE